MTASTDSQKALLFACDPMVDMLSKGDIPIWPVRTKSELAALHTIADSFGGIIAPGQDAMPRKLSGEGLVVALGRETATQAELYAHLTGRRCAVAASLNDLSGLTPAVLVTTEDRVTEVLLEALYDEPRQTCAIGLVYGRTAEQLRQQVLIRSAAAHLCSAGLGSSPTVHRVDIMPTTGLGHAVSRHWQLLGNCASPADLKEALAARAGVLALISHSDGIDSPLSKEAVLCAVAGALPDARSTAGPACVVTGICHRRHEPIEVALRSPALIDPNVIQARILVADICWGLMPPLDIIHPAWALGHSFLLNSAIGAFITPWEITRTSIQLVTPLTDAIAQGTPVGEALANQLASERWRRFGCRMCLIGDPRVRLPKSPLAVSLGDVVPPPAPADRRAKAGAVGFLRAYITLARQNTDGTYEDRSEDALAAIDTYEKALWTGRSLEGSSDSPGAALRDEFIRFASGRFSVAYPIWQQFADDWTALRRQPCFACGRSAVAVEFRLCIPGAPDRRVTNCQSCGTVEDMPTGMDLTFAVSPEGEVQLVGELPSGRCAGVLMLETSTPDRCRVFSWPGDEKGGLARQLRAPPPWPEGPIRVSVIIISESCDLISLGRQCRGERMVST